MKIKRILAKRICLIAGTVLSVVIGGQLSGSNHDSEESEGVCGGRCTLGHAMELGHSNYYQRVYLEHFEPKNLFLLNRYPNYIF